MVHSSTNSFHFVPTLLLSNTISLAPKIDEIAYTIKQKNLDLALFTETWLKESIPDQSIKITGYQLFRRDRKTVHTEVFVRSLKILLTGKHC